MSVSQESFKKKLKEKGLKVTNQRLLVLQVLAENKDRHCLLYTSQRSQTVRAGDRAGSDVCEDL